MDLSTNLVTLPSCIAPFIGHASRISDLYILCTSPGLGELSILGHLSSLKRLRLQVTPELGPVQVPHCEFYSMIYGLETVFRSLEYAEAHTLFPCLQSLVIRTQTVWDPKTELSVVRMIESRCTVPDNHSQLRSVLIEYCPSVMDAGGHDEIWDMEICCSSRH
ncbi:hypothetical protein CPB85DRAFT_816729 [Mucidula mucida]|nr:hypothetical protein CPB85DRAFT_816729 [Mucidula mucida]